MHVPDLWYGRNHPYDNCNNLRKYSYIPVSDNSDNRYCDRLLVGKSYDRIPHLPTTCCRIYGIVYNRYQNRIDGDWDLLYNYNRADDNRSNQS